MNFNGLLFWLPRCSVCLRRKSIFLDRMCFNCHQDISRAQFWEQLVKAIRDEF